MSKLSEESLALRTELAYACRILAANGQNDTVYGHVTYRQEGADTFWMKPAGFGLDEITPEMLIRLDFEGNVVEGNYPAHKELPIHAEIYRARPKVRCVVHTHPLHAVAFGATRQPLRAVSHEGAQFYPAGVAHFTLTSDLIVTKELGSAVNETLGDGLACLLVNHGIVVAGETIEQATVAAINLERASQVQLLAASANSDFVYSSEKDMEGKRQKFFTPFFLKSVWDYYCRQVGAK